MTKFDEDMCRLRCRRYHHLHHHGVSWCRWWWWCRVVVVGVVLLRSCGEATTSGESGEENNMYAESLGHVDRIRVVTCTSDTADQEIVSVKIFDTRNDSTLVFVGLRAKQCRASHVFSSCDFDLDQHKVTLRAIINDLEEGEMRRYGCEVLRVTSDGSLSTFYYVNVTHTVPSTTTTTTSTTGSGSTVNTGNTLGSTAADAGFVMPNTVVFVVLGLLVFFITLCCVLGIHYYRGRRRKRKSRDCDAISVRSGVTDKDFYTVGFNPNGGGDLGIRGPPPRGGFVRQFSISSASTGMPNSAPSAVPEVPGGMCQRLVMQYQKPSDTVLVPAEVSTLTFSDRGYVSGSSVHYQEPWGRTLDDPEVLGKLSTLRSPNRHLVKIPHFHSNATPTPDTPSPDTITTTTATTAAPSAPPPPPPSESPPPSPSPSPPLPPLQESEPPPLSVPSLPPPECQA